MGEHLETLETEHGAAQEALRKGGERFRKIFDHSDDAIFVVDAVQDEMLDVYSKACEMLGYSREELLSMPMSAIHPYEMPKLQAFAKSVARSGHGWTDELTCLTRTGQFLPSEISASLIDVSGRSCMIALVRDISERKRAQERLKESEEKYRLITETSLDGIYQRRHFREVSIPK